MTIDAYLVIGPVVVFLLESLAHFLYRVDHGAPVQVSVVTRYVIGVGCFLIVVVPLGWTVYANSGRHVVILLLACIIAAAAATVLWRYVRPMPDERNAAEELAERQRILNDIMARYSAKDTK